MQKGTIGKDLNLAAELLRRGGLVAIPTETVYGLAANALNPDAVLKIFEAKNRPRFNPLIVHVAKANEMAQYAEVPKLARRLAERFCPGPLTLVLRKKPMVPDATTAGNPTVALRVPAHPMAQKLLSLLDFPLAAPSANPSGYVSPVTAEHVAENLGDKVDYILDGGRCQVGIESTVVAVEDGNIHILRAGAITPEMLAEFAPVTLARAGAESGSPGLLPSHYAPKTKLSWGKLETLLEKHRGLKVAILAFQAVPGEQNIAAYEILSPSGDLREAARNLFAALRRLDAVGANAILAEAVPEEGLGIAINDRLRRAAT
ncbi:MAG: L-threonylcarbamoyladenylate synthase [Turneriella sp.]|nr:L-threonylcarbamoyladenylate synthase [Turneriella sp.]